MLQFGIPEGENPADYEELRKSPKSRRMSVDEDWGNAGGPPMGIGPNADGQSGSRDGTDRYTDHDYDPRILPRSQQTYLSPPYTQPRQYASLRPQPQPAQGYSPYHSTPAPFSRQQQNTTLGPSHYPYPPNNPSHASGPPAYPSDRRSSSSRDRLQPTRHPYSRPHTSHPPDADFAFPPPRNLPPIPPYSNTPYSPPLTVPHMHSSLFNLPRPSTGLPSSGSTLKHRPVTAPVGLPRVKYLSPTLARLAIAGPVDMQGDGHDVHGRLGVDGDHGDSKLPSLGLVLGYADGHGHGFPHSPVHPHSHPHGRGEGSELPDTREWERREADTGRAERRGKKRQDQGTEEGDEHCVEYPLENHVDWDHRGVERGVDSREPRNSRDSRELTLRNERETRDRMVEDGGKLPSFGTLFGGRTG
jgi:hypothetical protein